MVQNRTHTCGELRLPDAGKQVKLSGWMENIREVGAELAFIVLRDFYGTTQIVAETPEMVAQFKAVNKEYRDKRPVVCIASFDNREEMARDDAGGEESRITAEVEAVMTGAEMKELIAELDSLCEKYPDRE